ncbi:MAG: DoxX family protein [Firmicutes bacterium]|nr:DoxX family protein [Bacillota bacterium]MCM1401569.1 DoxX family protein [Bacteroides sp.]MCM1477263.1 DoxX family protein [Bacteroides sp.]
MKTDKTDKKQGIAPSWFKSRMSVVIVWTLRIIVGGVFIVSGLAKAIDLWGVVFKFEEYFTVWGWDVPMPLTVLAAMALTSLEFLLGCLLALGCFRRTVTWALTGVMCFMLPLTLYVWLKSPVPDCGCFGDFLVISNGATFAKNIFLTAAILFLVFANKHVKYIYHPYSQWICGVSCLVFVTMVELYGFNVQPMVDFRSVPEGTLLIENDDTTDSGDEESDVDFLFIYSKNGVEKEFTTDSLPDSTWTFVDRKLADGNGAVSVNEHATLAIYDSDNEDVTADVLTGAGLEMMVIVPQHKRADMYYTSFTNELDALMNSIGGALVELTDVQPDSIEHLQDDTMAEFPIYSVESTTLKELSRGLVSVILLKDGVIQWKRNMGSIDVEALVSSPIPITALQALKPQGTAILAKWSEVLIAILAGLLIVDKLTIWIIKRRKNGKPENKSLNLQKESPQKLDANK